MSWKEIDPDNLPECEVLAVNCYRDHTSSVNCEALVGILCAEYKSVDFTRVDCEKESEGKVLRYCTHYYDIESILLPNSNETLTAPAHSRKSDKELILQLNKLLEAASNEADRWRGNDTTQEEYDNYRDWCYGKIWEIFWEIANQIKIKPENYYSDTTYEEDMRAYLKAHIHTNWISDAIDSL